MTGKTDCLHTVKSHKWIFFCKKILENIFFFFLPYNSTSLSSRLVAIVMRGSGKTQLNDEIIYKTSLLQRARLHTCTADYANCILSKKRQ